MFTAFTILTLLSWKKNSPAKKINYLLSAKKKNWLLLGATTNFLLSNRQFFHKRASVINVIAVHIRHCNPLRPMFSVHWYSTKFLI